MYRVGVDYYPEHWSEGRWERDAKLMKGAGFNVVRLAEFAWARMEPNEGQYEFDWLAKAVAILGKNGIKSILGTPTASMPPWLALKYPDALSTDVNGVKSVYGIRKNNCFTSGTFRLLSERITRAMAGRFSKNPNVIGWQTDNEFAQTLCFCDLCRADFQDWLRRKYKTIGELNRAWGTHFWNHIFRSWEEIPIMTKDWFDNPGLYLDWMRFSSWQNVRFQHDQVVIIRELCNGQFITHNTMGLAKGVNYFDLAEDLDFVAWDNYPMGKPEMELNINSAMAADVIRGTKKKNFWIMEQAAGTLGWGNMTRNTRPGELRKIAYQQYAHGADGMIWFRWRACTAGREQYWHGLLGHDGKPGRRYQEAKKTALELQRLSKETDGTTVKSGVAMIYDYDTIWAFEAQPAYAENKNYPTAMRRFYSALSRAGINADMVKPSDSFDGYKVVIAPHLYILPDEMAKRLSDFVKKGGILLADTRLGVKDETGLCHERTLPGLLSDALGIEIPEYEAIVGGDEYSLIGSGPVEGKFSAQCFADWMVPKKAESILSYNVWYLKKYSAATKNRFGKGLGYYVGTIVKEGGFYEALIQDVLREAKIRPVAVPPEGVEVSVRESKGKKILFLINHTEEEKSVEVPAGKTELISGKKTSSAWTLPAYEVAMIRL